MLRDCKWKIQERAEELAFDKTGRDYCDMLTGEQEHYYELAYAEYSDGRFTSGR